MVTKEQILKYLNSDGWFRPGSLNDTITIIDDNGNEKQVAKSYYHTISGGTKIIIRVSEHGTYLDTWVKRRDDPSKSLQNLSVVFSNEQPQFRREIQPTITYDSDGNEVVSYLYFIVEQYHYRLDHISMDDFKKVIKRIKQLEQEGVFTDPFKKKLNKKANRKVLTPLDKDGKEIPDSTNPIHSRQSVVGANRDYEVDKDGVVIRDNKKMFGRIIKEKTLHLTESQLRQVISKSIRRTLRKLM